MDAQVVIRSRPGEGMEVRVAGQPMAFLVTGQNSRHTSMFDWTLPPGFATGLHVHRVQEETFFVLEGECTWQVGDDSIHATAGTFVFIPPGVPHNIINASGERTARLLMTVSPPGHEHYFEELTKLTSQDSRPDAEAIGALRRRYDTDQLSSLKNG